MIVRFRSQSQFGSTWKQILIAVALIGLFSTVAIPTFIHARMTNIRKTCITNLKEIDRAKSTWALDQRKNTGDTVTDTNLFGPAAYLRSKPQCPAGGNYTLNPVGIKPRCDLDNQGHSL